MKTRMWNIELLEHFHVTGVIRCYLYFLSGELTSKFRWYRINSWPENKCMEFLPICTSKLHRNNMNRIQGNTFKTDFVKSVFKSSVYNVI